ncbi:MAG: aminopeptidase P family protein, partial [bacterium]|nr:aminopeptidase P family protein [bacterium]
LNKNRLSRLRKLLRSLKIGQNLLVSNLINIHYLSGFTGSNGYLIITPRHQELLTDFRYWEQAEEEAPDWTLIKANQSLIAELTFRIKKNRITTLVLEADTVTIALERLLKTRLPNVRMKPSMGMVEQLRMIKDAKEIEKVKKACSVADKALEEVSAVIKPGLREKDVANIIIQAIRNAGGEKESFDPIVASGPKGARPHALASERRLKTGEPVVVDFGAKVEGYCSDMTRTFHIGRPSNRFIKLYDIVLQAQQESIKAIKPGISCREIDTVARRIIGQAGYGNQFGHNLGHGVGLAVHEAPSFAPGNETRLAPGMILSVEPGIYIEEWGGIRIEDLIVVTEDGCEVLTQTDRTPRQLG